jgi:hypothetical protein
MAYPDFQGVPRSGDGKDPAEQAARENLLAEADEIAVPSNQTRGRLRWYVDMVVCIHRLLFEPNIVFCTVVRRPYMRDFLSNDGLLLASNTTPI